MRNTGQGWASIILLAVASVATARGENDQTGYGGQTTTVHLLFTCKSWANQTALSLPVNFAVQSGVVTVCFPPTLYRETRTDGLHGFIVSSKVPSQFVPDRNYTFPIYIQVGNTLSKQIYRYGSINLNNATGKFSIADGVNGEFWTDGTLAGLYKGGCITYPLHTRASATIQVDWTSQAWDRQQPLASPLSIVPGNNGSVTSCLSTGIDGQTSRGNPPDRIWSSCIPSKFAPSSDIAAMLYNFADLGDGTLQWLPGAVEYIQAQEVLSLSNIYNQPFTPGGAEIGIIFAVCMTYLQNTTSTDADGPEYVPMNFTSSAWAGEPVETLVMFSSSGSVATACFPAVSAPTGGASPGYIESSVVPSAYQPSMDVAFPTWVVLGDGSGNQIGGYGALEYVPSSKHFHITYLSIYGPSPFPSDGARAGLQKGVCVTYTL